MCTRLFLLFALMFVQVPHQYLKGMPHAYSEEDAGNSWVFEEKKSYLEMNDQSGRRNPVGDELARRSNQKDEQKNAQQTLSPQQLLISGITHYSVDWVILALDGGACLLHREAKLLNRTALHHALAALFRSYEYHEIAFIFEIIEILLSKAYKQNILHEVIFAKDSYGKTPFHYAALQQHEGIINLLLFYLQLR